MVDLWGILGGWKKTWLRCRHIFGANSWFPRPAKTWKTLRKMIGLQEKLANWLLHRTSPCAGLTYFSNVLRQPKIPCINSHGQQHLQKQSFLSHCVQEAVDSKKIVRRSTEKLRWTPMVGPSANLKERPSIHKSLYTGLKK